MRSHVKKYKEQNPDWVREKTSVRQQRMEKAGGAGYSLADIENLRRRLEDKCAYCGEPLNGGGHEDHMNPVVQGGRDEIENITLSCMKCNLAKHAKTVEEFVLWRQKRGLPVREQKAVKAGAPLPKSKLILVRKTHI